MKSISKPAELPSEFRKFNWAYILTEIYLGFKKLFLGTRNLLYIVMCVSVSVCGGVHIKILLMIFTF